MIFRFFLVAIYIGIPAAWPYLFRLVLKKSASDHYRYVVQIGDSVRQHVRGVSVPGPRRRSSPTAAGLCLRGQTEAPALSPGRGDRGDNAGLRSLGQIVCTIMMPGRQRVAMPGPGLESRSVSVTRDARL